jgi:hypothetical protein
MAEPEASDQVVRSPSVTQRLFAALGEATSSFRRGKPAEEDLLDVLTREEDRVRDVYWPDSKPSGRGQEFLDQLMTIRVGELRWRSRLRRARDVVWLAGATIGTTVAGGLAWTSFVG